jgi:MoaA/NifB/PqqE/SkfB family radical SAM enzyme
MIDEIIKETKKHLKNIIINKDINLNLEFDKHFDSVFNESKKQHNINSIEDLKKFSMEDIVQTLSESINEKINKNSKILNFNFNNPLDCCLAPYVSMDFDTRGGIRVCCYNGDFILGVYPENSLIDSWNNPKRNDFINSLKEKNFPKGCSKCVKQIFQKNYNNALFAKYDGYYDKINPNYPSILTFNFATICNYECIMCGGKWSSSIRKNREKLPPIKSPYDDKFIDELKPFLSNAKVINFLGGEPFLNPIYYKILNNILIRNKNVEISITTNGSILNSKIEQYIKLLPNLKIVLSLDSLEEKTYQYIRKNSNYKTVMNNLEKFKKMERLSSLTICPMIQNIYEIPNIFKYCFENNIKIYLNAVFGHLGGKLKGIHEGENNNQMVWSGGNHVDIIPDGFKNSELIPEVALNTLPKEKLNEIISFIEDNRPFFVKEEYVGKQNEYKLIYDEFVLYLKSLL